MLRASFARFRRAGDSRRGFRRRYLSGLLLGLFLGREGVRHRLVQHSSGLACIFAFGKGPQKQHQINSISGLCLTKLDVLDGLDVVRLCVGYKNADGDVLEAPTDADSYIGLQPVYEEMPGWSESTAGAKTLEELPANARAYIKRVEELVGAPIDIISTGPDRNETIILRHPFA